MEVLLIESITIGVGISLKSDLGERWRVEKKEKAGRQSEESEKQYRKEIHLAEKKGTWKPTNNLSVS